MARPASNGYRASAPPGALSARFGPPWRWDFRQHRLPSGQWVTIRPLRPDDGRALATAVEGLSARSRYRRFHSAVPRLTEQMIIYLTDIDHHDHEALVAFSGGTSGTIVGVARFIRDPSHPDDAEVAVAVADPWQRRGLATLLLHRLCRRARQEGIASLTGYILTENHPTIALFGRLGPRHLEYQGSTVTAHIDLATWPADDPDNGRHWPALAAAEVAMIPLETIAPAVILTILEVSVDIIRNIWATSRFIGWSHVNVSPDGSGRPSPARVA